MNDFIIDVGSCTREKPEAVFFGHLEYDFLKVLRLLSLAENISVVFIHEPMYDYDEHLDLQDHVGYKLYGSD